MTRIAALLLLTASVAHASPTAQLAVGAAVTWPEFRPSSDDHVASWMPSLAAGELVTPRLAVLARIRATGWDVHDPGENDVPGITYHVAHVMITADAQYWLSPVFSIGGSVGAVDEHVTGLNPDVVQTDTWHLGAGGRAAVSIGGGFAITADLFTYAARGQMPKHWYAVPTGMFALEYQIR